MEQAPVNEGDGALPQEKKSRYVEKVWGGRGGSEHSERGHVPPHHHACIKDGWKIKEEERLERAWRRRGLQPFADLRSMPRKGFPTASEWGGKGEKIPRNPLGLHLPYSRIASSKTARRGAHKAPLPR